MIDRGTISGNTALYGGGVYVLDNGKVQNCKLYQNTGTFDAEGVVSYGQFLTALTRFVEPEKGYIGSFNVLDHWAAPAAIKAASAGWIDDVPIDLNAPATYGTFVNLLTKIFAL